MALGADTRSEFLRLLARDGKFRQEMRRQRLGAELIEWPEQFAAFAARVDEFMAG